MFIIMIFKQLIIAISILTAQSLSVAGPSITPVNSVNTIVNDMKLKNDAVLKGYETQKYGWYVGPGHVVMGITPLTTYTPSWYRNSFWNGLPEVELKAILPWVVLFDAVDNTATNTSLNIRDVKLYVLQKSTNKWLLVSTLSAPTGYEYGKAGIYNVSAEENRKVLPDGSSLIKPPANTNTVWHGWGKMALIPIPRSDIGAWFVTMQARIVVGDESKPNDLDKAKYLLHVGADYYRSIGTQWTPMPNPGVGVSRSKLLTRDWQAFNFVTFSNVGVQDPGGGITEAEFRANPPPLE